MKAKFILKNWSYIFLIFSILLFIISMFSNKSYFEAISINTVYCYQTRQVLCILLLYAIGFSFLKAIQHKLDDLAVCLLSFPTALCLWSFSSELLLLCDITYRFWRVLFLICIFIAACYLIRTIKHLPLIKSSLSFCKVASIVIGISCLVSTGFLYIVLNYDSYFYFSNYGKALALMMSYKDIVSDNSFVLTNIGQFLPLVSAYATYFKIDTIIPIQAFMIINLLLAYTVCIYRYARNFLSFKKATEYAALFLLILVTCSPFFLFTNWILSNTWVMFYLFFMFWLSLQEDAHSHNSGLYYGIDIALLICLFAIAITMLRKDGLVIVSFLFVCYSIKHSLEATTIDSINRIAPFSWYRWLRYSLLPALLLLPATAYLTFYIYYLRHIICAQTTLATGSSLLAEHQTKPMLLIVGLVFIYLLFLHIPAEIFFKKYLPHIMTMVFIMGILSLCLIDITRFIEYTDAWLRNLGGTAFGYSAIGILLSFGICLLKKSNYDYPFYLSINYILLVLIIYWNKGNTETNIDNSGLRALYQIIPIFFCSMAFRILPILLSANNTTKGANAS